MAESAKKCVSLRDFFKKTKELSEDNPLVGVSPMIQDRQDSPVASSTSSITVHELDDHGDDVLHPSSSENSDKPSVYTPPTCDTPTSLIHGLPASHSHVPSNDFGLIAQSIAEGQNPSDASVKSALTERWAPCRKEDFPVSYRMNQGKLRPRILNENHLKRFQWLAISRHCHFAGAWCSVAHIQWNKLIYL